MPKSFNQIYLDYIEPIREEWPKEASQNEEFHHDVGDLGEIFAIDYLQKNGFKFCRADNIANLGHSLVSGENHAFDCTVGELDEISEKCRELFMCCRSNIPCKNNKTEFFKFNPNAAKTLGAKTDGEISGLCVDKLSYAGILDCSEDIRFGTQGVFVRRYLQIHNYIVSRLSLINKKANMELKDKPGRLDFFAWKDGKYYCLDSKVNTSVLSKYQCFRMAWMSQFGYYCGVIRVKFYTGDMGLFIREFENKKFDILYENLAPKISFEEFKANQDDIRDIPSKEQVSACLEKSNHSINPNDGCFYWVHCPNGRYIEKIPPDYRNGDTDKIKNEDIIGILESEKDWEDAWTRLHNKEESAQESNTESWPQGLVIVCVFVVFIFLVLLIEKSR